MIFFSIGILFLIIGSLFRIMPSKGNLPFYGYHSPLAAKTDAHWRLAQKTSGNWFFLIRLTDDIDRLLLKDIWTYELFFDRDAIIGISNYAHFYYDRKKITEISMETGGNDNEYFND